jgi:serpin B
MIQHAGTRRFSVVAFCRIAGLVLLTGLQVLLGQAELDGRRGVALAQSAPQPAPASAPEITSALVRDVVAASNRTGADLFARMMASAPDQSVVMSPYSLDAALAMVAQGARGATAEGFRRFMQLGGRTLADAAAGQQALIARLRQPSEATLAVANSAWVHQDIALRPEFATSLSERFAGEIAAVDLTSPATLARINGWVSDRTGGMIPHMLDDLPRDAKLVLVNALYFRGAWQMPFEPLATRPRPFHLAGGRTRDVPMMRMTARLAYAETPLYQAVELAYRGSELRLRVILPRSAERLSEMRARAARSGWGAIDDAPLAERRVNLSLPRFRAESGSDLAAILQRTDLAPAFGDNADFSGIADRPLKLSRVVHRATITLTELGTEAAAATSEDMVPAGAGLSREPIAEMVVDRPFILVLRDPATTLELMLAFVADPGAVPAPAPSAN